MLGRSSHLMEWCAEMFGVTATSRFGRLVGFAVGLVALSVFLVVRWGIPSIVAPLILLLAAANAARSVIAARAKLWRTATLPVGSRSQKPKSLVDQTFSSSELALRRLAVVTDHVRAGRLALANEIIPTIDLERLLPGEIDLLEAVKAMILVALGAQDQAARRLDGLLPVGSADFDTCLGRTLLADAWRDPSRLAAIDARWRRAGTIEGSLARLHRLVRLRIDPSLVDGIRPDEARVLAEEARALGDDEMAAELAVRSHEGAYR